MAKIAKMSHDNDVSPETAEQSAHLDADEVQNLLGTMEQLGELAGELNNPELLKLLREVRAAGENFRLLLAEINRLQESGVMDTLVQLAVMVQSVKDSLTAGVVSDMMGQAVHFMTILDRLQTSGADELLMNILDSLQESIKEQEHREPQSVFGLVRQLNRDPQTKKSLNVMLGFLQQLAPRL